MTPSPTKDDVLASLRSFLIAVMPPGVEIVEGQLNRVPEVQGSDFVVMQQPRFERLETNVDESADVRFTGSIAGLAMTVTAVAFGTIEIGATVFGVGVAAGTTILSQTSGSPGAAGVYAVSVSQALASGTLSAGQKIITQNAKVTVQLDVHGPNGADNAEVISTLMRDPFATEQFEAQSPNFGIAPLLADDPRQIPFVNDQQQYEDRWVVEAMLQADQVVNVPQQYADSVSVEIVSIDASYPP